MKSLTTMHLGVEAGREAGAGVELAQFGGRTASFAFTRRSGRVISAKTTLTKARLPSVGVEDGCGPPGRLADQRVAHGGEALAREAELDVVLASLAPVELTLGALPGYDAIVIVEPLDRLIGLSEALGVMAPDRFGNVMHAIRPEEEVPTENVPPEQIHHLGLAVGGRRAGRGHLLKPRSSPPIPRYARRTSSSASVGDPNHRTDSRLAPWPSHQSAKQHLDVDDVGLCPTRPPIHGRLEGWMT
jgi:hypothetical protein